jgi:hypothetical protein
MLQPLGVDLADLLCRNGRSAAHIAGSGRRSVWR